MKKVNDKRGMSKKNKREKVSDSYGPAQVKDDVEGYVESALRDLDRMVAIFTRVHGHLVTDGSWRPDITGGLANDFAVAATGAGDSLRCILERRELDRLIVATRDGSVPRHGEPGFAVVAFPEAATETAAE